MKKEEEKIDEGEERKNKVKDKKIGKDLKKRDLGLIKEKNSIEMIEIRLEIIEKKKDKWLLVLKKRN